MRVQGFGLQSFEVLGVWLGMFPRKRKLTLGALVFHFRV